MAVLPAGVVKGFVQQVQPDKAVLTGSMHYGTAKIIGGELFVTVDGSDVNTPAKTTVAVRNGDRIKAEIRNHTLTITGNMTDQPLGTGALADILSGALNDYVITNSAIIDSTFSNGLINGSVIKDSTITGSQIADSTIEGSKIKESTITGSNIEFSSFEKGVISGSAIDVSTFTNGTIEGSKIKNSTITGAQIAESTIEASHIAEATFGHIIGTTIEAINADIEKIKAGELEAEGVMADWAAISEITTDKISAAAGYIDYLESNEIKVENLQAMYIKTTKLEADYIQMGFANIDRATIESFYAKQGMIENVVMKESTVTGELVAVSFTGDVLEANTIKADRLLLKGDDGLYYGVNVNAIGETKVSALPDEEQEELKNGLHGEALIAHSVTAEKITVADLSAFGATIGGFEIDATSIHSIGKASPDSRTPGSYISSDGSVHFGSPNQYMTFDPQYENTDGTVGRLEIRTSNIYLEGGLDMADMSNNIEKYNLYMRFDGKTMDLGHISNEMILRLTNKGLGFLDQNNLVSYILGDTMYTSNSVVMKTMRFNNFLWEARSNGRMSLRHVEGDVYTDIPDEVYTEFGLVVPKVVS